MKTKGMVAAVCAALLGGTIVVVQYRQLGALREENRALRVRGAQLELFNDENARIKERRIDSDEIDRLRKQQSELFRLRGEITGLRRELAEARAQNPGHTKAAPPLDLTQTDDSYWVRNFSQELSATVPAGHTLLLGGWETNPGTRTFVLTTPFRIDAAGNFTSNPNATQATIESYIVELTEAAARELGLSKFAPVSGDQEGLHQLFKKEETQDLLKGIKETEGANILSSPRILVGTGTQGTVSITEPFQAPNGHELNVGPEISILPNIDSKTDGIEIAVKAELNLRTANEAPKL